MLTVVFIYLRSVPNTSEYSILWLSIKLVLRTSFVLKQFSMILFMSPYCKMIECRRLLLLLIMEEDGSMQKWTGTEVSKNNVQDDIWSVNIWCNVRLYAFPLWSSLKRVNIMASGKTTEKTVFGKGTQTYRWNCYILMNHEECRFWDIHMYVHLYLSIWKWTFKFYGN